MIYNYSLFINLAIRACSDASPNLLYMNRLEVLSDALPLGELHLQILIVEEESGLPYPTLELPVEPLHDGLGVVTSVLLVISAAVAVLGVEHDNGDIVGDALVVLLGLFALLGLFGFAGLTLFL